MRGVWLALVLAVAGWGAHARELIIYTDRQESLIVFIAAAFEVESGVETTVVYNDVSQIASLRHEGRSLPFDVVMTKDAGTLLPLLYSGALAPIRSEVVLDRVRPEFRDPHGRWIGLSRRTRAFHVSADRVEPGAIRTYEDLTDERWRGRICSRPLDHSYNVQLISALIANYGEDHAREWLAAVRENLVGEPGGSDRDQIRLVADGACDVALGNDYYRGILERASDGDDVLARTRLVIPTFEDGGGFAMLTAAAISRGSERQAEGEAFIEFMLSERGQRMLMSIAYERPVVADVPLDGDVAEWGDIPAPSRPVFEHIALRGDALAVAREGAVLQAAED